MKTTAIVIARGGSTRLPNKNMLMFHGQPLVAHKVSQLKQCASISEVIVGSDSDEILDAAEKAGARTVKRPAEYCDEKSKSWNDVIHHMVSYTEPGLVVWAHCTNPCIHPALYSRAIRQFLISPNIDSIVSVTAFHNHVWWGNKPLNFDPYVAEHKTASQLPPVYFQNGGIFIALQKDMIKWRYVYGPKPGMFVIHPQEATDIDTQEDFDRAVKLYPLVSL